VAVKQNQDASSASVRAFTQEAELLARLQHSNLPRVTDHFIEVSGYQYLVMDYVAGENLDGLVERQGRLDERTALAMLSEVMDAVAYLHQQQPPIIHRDVKPSNLIRRQLDGRIILVDFGLAKQQVAGGGTLTGARAVTPGFAPPEQYFGRTDARSDVYSLGATLYFLVTGVVPPEAPARSSGYTSLVLPSKVNSGLSPEVESAILRAMDLDVSRRFPDVPALTTSLLGGRATLQWASPISTNDQTGRRRRVTVGLAFVAVVLLVGMLLLRLAWPSSQPLPGQVTVVARAEASVVMTHTASPLNTAAATVTKAPNADPTVTTPAAVPTETVTAAPTATLAPTTAVPTSTDLPPTPTPVPPTPTLALVEYARLISLASLANASTEQGYEAPPLGVIMLGGVPFELPGGRNSATTQAESLPANPTLLVADTQINGPQRVHLLLTGGNLFAEYQDRPFGHVRLRFASGAVQEERLVAGYNMREWKIYDQATVATTTAPNVREVWRTRSLYGGTGVIDMLTIEVAAENRGSTLVAVELEDTSVQNVNSMDPAINWLGLTVVGLEPAT